MIIWKCKIRKQGSYWWFAWRPVYCADINNYVWLEFVERIWENAQSREWFKKWSYKSLRKEKE